MAAIDNLFLKSYSFRVAPLVPCDTPPTPANTASGPPAGASGKVLVLYVRLDCHHLRLPLLDKPGVDEGAIGEVDVGLGSPILIEALRVESSRTVFL